MPDYRVRILRPEHSEMELYAGTVSTADNPQHARAIALERFRTAGGLIHSAEACWVEVYEEPDDIIVLRVPVDLLDFCPIVSE